MLDVLNRNVGQISVIFCVVGATASFLLMSFVGASSLAFIPLLILGMLLVMLLVYTLYTFKSNKSSIVLPTADFVKNIMLQAKSLYQEEETFPLNIFIDNLIEALKNIEALVKELQLAVSTEDKFKTNFSLLAQFNDYQTLFTTAQTAVKLNDSSFEVTIAAIDKKDLSRKGLSDEEQQAVLNFKALPHKELYKDCYQPFFDNTMQDLPFESFVQEIEGVIQDFVSKTSDKMTLDTSCQAVRWLLDDLITHKDSILQQTTEVLNAPSRMTKSSTLNQNVKEYILYNSTHSISENNKPNIKIIP